MRRLLGAVALALVAARASGQGMPLATLAGTVTAEGGKPIPGVTVSVASPALLGTREAVTSRSGKYLIALLPPGDYRVSFEATGLEQVVRTVVLPAATTTRLDQALRPAPVAESVTVSGETARERGTEIAANYPQTLLNVLPSQRTLRDAALLAPGVNENGPTSSLGSASQRPAIMISGAPSYENLFLVDGVVVNENLRGQPQDLFIEDAIQETTVQTGRISAEYGRFLGGVVDVATRSGGNRPSGSFRTTFTNGVWAANDPYDRSLGLDNRVDHVDETYEATLGFPLWKDRVWAFTAARSADLGQSMETRPLPLKGNVDPAPVPYTYGRDERRLEGKLTTALAPRVSLVASYIGNRLDETNYAFNRAILSTETLMPRTLPNSLLALNASGVVSGSLFLEGQYSRRRFEIDQGGPDFTDPVRGTHIFDLTGFRRFGAPQFSGQSPSRFDNDTWFAKASTLLSAGSFGEHDLRFGYERFAESTLEQNDFSSSGYVVDETRSIVRGTEVFPSFQNDGSTTIEWHPIAAPARETPIVTDSAYVNDQVELGRHWSANLGLRWDKNHARSSSGALVSDSGALSPRLDVRFDPRGDGRLLFDASYGKYVTKVHPRLANAASSAGNPADFEWTYAGPCINCDVSAPTSALLSKDQALAQLFAWFDSIGGTASTPTAGASLPGYSTRIAPGGLRSPYANEISAGIESALGSSGFARIDGLYRDYRDQYSGRIDTTTGQTPPDPFGNVYDVEEIGNSDRIKRRYAALQLQLQNRFGARLAAAATYTWSHLTGNFIGEYNRDSATWGMVNEYPEYKQESWNSPYGDVTGEGISPFSPDERHRARAWAIYQVPLRRGNLSVSALEEFDSGLGYEAVGPIDPRPYRVNPGYADPLGNAGRPGTVQYSFTRPGKYRTDDITHTDVALDWSLPAYRSAQLFVHAQVFNLFNQAGVVAVDTTVLTARDDPKNLSPFDPFTDKPKEGVNYRLGPNFGKPTSSASYQAPRTFELGVGVRF